MHRSCKISGLADALTERGIVRPSPIQQLAMPKLAQGCLATERCIGLYYRYINVVCIWCIHVFQRKKHAQKKNDPLELHGDASDKSILLPTQMDHGDGKLYYSYEIDCIYIYIYFIKISTHKIGNISHGPAIPSSEPQVSISSSMRPPGVGRPWPISCRCWRDFSCLGQLGNPQMKYYIWRVLMCFNRNIHGKSTIN